MDLFANLPSGKHLALLGRYNLSRATATNMTILGIPSVRVGDACDITRGDIELFQNMPAAVPESLQPTPLQLSTPHEPWVDLFPCPQLRDSIITYAETEHFDSNEFMYDAAGRLEHECTVGEEPHEPGMYVWSDPWSAQGWELTENFISKWQCLLVGCDDLLRSTNYWRSLRGEKMLGSEQDLVILPQPGV